MIIVIRIFLMSCVFLLVIRNTTAQEPDRLPVFKIPSSRIDIDYRCRIERERVFPTKVRIMAVGDLLFHKGLIDAAYCESDTSYSFFPFFSEIAPLLQSADLAIGNFEVTVSAKKGKYAGYPRFRVPEDVVSDLKQSGFDVLTTANNHALDWGEAGVRATITTLRKHGIIPVGTLLPAERKNRLVVVNDKGIRFAFLAVTYSTNNMDKKYPVDSLVNLIRIEEIRHEVSAARALGADVIICAVHFGAEYERKPNCKQQRIVKELLDLGVHIVLGSHPHVVQPALLDSLGKSFVIYSLGNFISDQRKDFKDIGIVVDFDVEKDYVNGDVRIGKIIYHPTYIHKWLDRGKVHYRIVHFQSIADANCVITRAAKSALISKYGEDVAHGLTNHIQAMVKDDCPVVKTSEKQAKSGYHYSK